MKISPEDAEKAFLDFGSEDTCALFEVVWGLRTKHPSASTSELLDAARTAARRLIEDGCIALYAGTGLDPNEAEIQTREAIHVIEDDLNWSPSTKSEKQFWFSNTDRGNRRYFDGE